MKPVTFVCISIWHYRSSILSLSHPLMHQCASTSSLHLVQCIHAQRRHKWHSAQLSHFSVVQAWTAQQLQQDLGFAPEQAQQLSEWSHGRDKAPVAERPPPKTLSIQMTLTPIPLVMHPSMGRDIAVAGGKAGMTNSNLVWPRISRCVPLLRFWLDARAFPAGCTKYLRVSWEMLLICLQQCRHCMYHITFDCFV